jgi:hypothetical protein
MEHGLPPSEPAGDAHATNSTPATPVVRVESTRLRAGRALDFGVPA